MFSFGDYLSRFFRMFKRVIPVSGTLAQAIAYNLFLAFFPTLLLAVGVASTHIGGKSAVVDAISHYTRFLPPGSQDIVTDFLSKRGANAWKYALAGSVGTLFAGTQVMKLLMDGIHRIYGDEENLDFLTRQIRGLLLLLITITPLMLAGILGVFGRPLRRWLAATIGKTAAASTVWFVIFPLVAMLLAMLALTFIYWVARMRKETLDNLLPGAVLATVLWWLVNVSFGFYVRRVPYNIVYGGLAAVIGLLIWMQLSTVVVFLGAAWNAEAEQDRLAWRRRNTTSIPNENLPLTSKL